MRRRSSRAKENPILPILLGIAGLAALGGATYYIATRNSGGNSGNGSAGGGPQVIGPSTVTTETGTVGGQTVTTPIVNGVTTNTAGTPPTGGYQETCEDTTYTVHSDGSGELTSICKTTSGSEQLSSLEVPAGYTGPIDNVNGTLSLT